MMMKFMLIMVVMIMFMMVMIFMGVMIIAMTTIIVFIVVLIVRNLQVVPVYSREDIREQYCINDKELQVGAQAKLAFRIH